MHRLLFVIVMVMVGGAAFAIAMVTRRTVTAGSLTPPAAPAATYFTLSDIYTRLTTNGTSVEGGHVFSPGGPAAPSMRTLKEVYEAIPTIAADTVELGTTYLGVSGTLIPSGGNAQASQVLSAATFFGNGQSDWVLQTGTMPNIGAQVITPGTADQTITLGYHDGSGYVHGDADLLAGNIRDGVDIFGTVGTMATSPLYGDDNANMVLTTAANPGLYDASQLTPDNVRNTVSYGVGQTGTFTGTLAFGDNDAAKVLTTAASAGTYNASNLNVLTVQQGVSFGAGEIGLLTPDGGTAGVADLFNGKTANLTADWTLDTGTLNLACNTATFDGNGNLVANAYDGAGNGTNRWCITDSGDAVAADILSGKVAWVDGIAVTGSVPAGANVNGGEGLKTFTITDGLYSGSKTATANDADLVATNIKNGVNIFGVTGTLSSGYSFGDNDASKVLTTAAAAGSFDATNLTAAVVRLGTGFGVGLTGTLVPSGGTAAAANVLSGSTFFGGGQGDWTLNTGTMPNIGAQVITPGTADQTITLGYHNGAGYVHGDADLAVANIKNGINIFGVAGTFLSNMFNGTGQSINGGSQANGGVDDYNNGGAAPTDRYYDGWTECNAGNSYCNTDSSAAAYKDNSTGLVWSFHCTGTGTTCTPGTGTAKTYTWSNAGSACTGISGGGWTLPHQKQGLMAYIDGSYGNLISINTILDFWSSTAGSDATTKAWKVNLSTGLLTETNKTGTGYVRCVR